MTGGKDVSVWVVPGGGIEQDETPAEAAVREVCEEAGVKGRLIRSLGTFVVRWQFTCLSCFCFCF